MDLTWATSRLQDFEIAVNAYIEMMKSFDGYNPMVNREVLRHEYAAKRILRAIDPPLADFTWGSESGVEYTVRDNVIRGLAILDDREEVERNLGPEGPTISVSELHPVVWGAAAQLWQNGHPNEAVQRAATFVSAHVQSRVGRTDVADVALMNEAFSERDPTVGKPRLRWPGQTQDQTVKSMNDGIRRFAPGVFLIVLFAALAQAPGSRSHSKQRQVNALEGTSTVSFSTSWRT